MKSLRVAMFVLQTQICFLLFELVTSKETFYVETGLPSHTFPVLMRSKFSLLLFAGISCALHAIDITVKSTFQFYFLALLVIHRIFKDNLLFREVVLVLFF